MVWSALALPTRYTSCVLTRAEGANHMSDLLTLACELIARPSLTPEDAGCQALIAERLRRAGFAIEARRYGAVDNLWASHGDGGPVLCLLGHTDVVPTGPRAAWQSEDRKSTRLNSSH